LGGSRRLRCDAMLLYDSAVSGNCYKVRLLLTKLGMPFERRELSVFDRSDRPHVLGELNPALRVPTLVLDDGRSLSESNAILWYFADGTEYVPTDPYERAQVMQWQFFEQYDHEPNIAVARFWALADITPSEADAEAKRKGGERALAGMERHLAEREYLVGERFSIADIALYAYTHVAPEGGYSLQPYPAVREWLARVSSQPGHIAITD
jgi:glutathione S-transferase